VLEAIFTGLETHEMRGFDYEKAIKRSRDSRELRRTGNDPNR
jgi:hypothetical protein